MAKRRSATASAPALALGGAAAIPFSAVEPDDGGIRTPPTEFRIFATGENGATKGGMAIRLLFDDEAARSVMDAFAKSGRPFLTFDYEHQAASQIPVEAPSAGTFVPEVRDGELWATAIKWTKRATQYLREGEYLLFSPWVMHDEDKGDGSALRVRALMNVALTNVPALDGIQPLVAADAKAPNPDPEDHMEEKIKELEAKLAAAEAKCAELTKLLEAATAPADKAKDAEGADAKALGAELAALTGKPSRAGILGVVEGWKRGAEEAVTLRADAEKTRAIALSAKFDAVLADAKTAGVPVAKVDEIKARALASFGANGAPTDGAVEFASSVLGALRDAGGTIKTGQHAPGAPPAAGALTEGQLQVLRVSGQSPEAFLKFRAERAAAGAGR